MLVRSQIVRITLIIRGVIIYQMIILYLTTRRAQRFLVRQVPGEVLLETTGVGVGALAAGLRTRQPAGLGGEVDGLVLAPV